MVGDTEEDTTKINKKETLNNELTSVPKSSSFAFSEINIVVDL